MINFDYNKSTAEFKRIMHTISQVEETIVITHVIVRENLNISR